MNVTPDDIKSNVENLELYSDKYPFKLSLRISTFENDVEYNKFIKNCEKLVRGSLEYKCWRNYIIDVLGINECILTKEVLTECHIEIHHHLPSLFTIIKALVNKKMEDQESFSTFDISLETIKLHFQNKIGYATLVESIHEKFHNGFLKIPIELIKGNYIEFIKEYSRYLDDDDLEIINERMAILLKDYKYEGWSKDEYPGLENFG